MVSARAIGLPGPRRASTREHPWLLWLTFATCVTAGALGVLHIESFAVLAAFALAVGVAIVAYRHPAGALVVAFAALPLSSTKFRVRPATDSMSAVLDAQIVFELGLYALIAGITLVVALSPAFRPRRLSRTELLLGVYVAITAGSALWSLSPTFTAVKAAQLAILFGLCAIAARVLAREDMLAKLAWVTVPYVLICAAMALAFPAFRSRSLTREELPRFSWFYVHPIGAATYLALAAIGLCVWAQFTPSRNRARTRLVATALLAPVLFVLMLTRSRGPIIACAIAIGIIVMRSRAPRWLVAAAAATGIVLLGLYLNSGFSLLDWLATNSGVAPVEFLLRNQRASDLADFSGREDLWKGAAQLFSARPLFGYGYAGARGLLLDTMPWAGDAHNAAFQTLLDVGLVGSLPLCLTILGAVAGGLLRSWRRVWPGEYTHAAALGFLAFILANSVTDVGFAEPGYVFVLLVTSIAALEEIGRSPSQSASRV